MRRWITERILAPAGRLDLILDLDILRDTLEVRSTIIYETVRDKRIIVSQTLPPILNSRVGQKISATYLVKDHRTGEQERYGFTTEILQFIEEYKLNRRVKVQALALAFPQSEIKKTQARLLHRVSLTPDCGLGLAIRGLGPEEEVALLDISLGGLLFSYKGYADLNLGRRIRITLTRGKETVIPAVRVVRVFEREGSRLLFVGCRFVNSTPEENQAVRELVHDIMRLELRFRSGLLEGNKGREGQTEEEKKQPDE